jgi:hypothetical protein
MRVQVKLACPSTLRHSHKLRTKQFFNSCSTFEKQQVCYIFQKLFEVTVSCMPFLNTMYILPPQKSSIKKASNRSDTVRFFITYCLLCAQIIKQYTGVKMTTNYDAYGAEAAALLRARDAEIASYKDGKGEFQKEGTICSICLEGFCDMDNKAMTNCKHVYHNRCIKKWSRKHTCCPYCRALIDTWWYYPSHVPFYVRLVHGKLW